MKPADFPFLLKVSRPGFWLTSLWFYLLPVGQRWVFGSWEFWLGAVWVTFPLGLLIYGWNDMADAETDRLNPRKGNYLFGAKAAPEQLRRLPWMIALVQAPFLVAFCWVDGWRVLPWAAVLVASTAIYNGPAGGLKGRPPFDMLNQAGYLLVFVISSWLNDAPQLPWSTYVFGLFFAMHSHLFGQIMDVEPDRLAGRRTTATTLGIRASKALLVGFLLVEALLVGWFSGDALMTLFSLGAAAWFVLDLAFLWRGRIYEIWQMRLFLMGWNAVAVITMPLVWYTASLTRLIR